MGMKLPRTLTLPPGTREGKTVADGIAGLAPRWAGRWELAVPGLKVKSEANQREHFMTRHRRKVGQQNALAAALVGLSPPPAGRPIRVTFTREYAGRGKRLDTDNLAGSFKHVQDGLAKWLGRDDGDQGIEWRYGQRPAGAAGLVIIIEEAGR